MRIPLLAVVMSVTLLTSGTASIAASKKTDAPGQDRTCLVTTKNANSWNDTDVANTKWLPRKAAEAQASKDPSTMRVFDYGNDPLVTGGTYASAEELCEKHFN
jgi:hypothetical protein